jgi:hypothetical protein
MVVHTMSELTSDMSRTGGKQFLAPLPRRGVLRNFVEARREARRGAFRWLVERAFPGDAAPQAGGTSREHWWPQHQSAALDHRRALPRGRDDALGPWRPHGWQAGGITDGRTAAGSGGAAPCAAT